MSASSWNAGIIRPVPVAPAGPYQDGAAPGVWTLDQVAYWQKQGLWPVAGNAAPRGLFGGGADSVNTLVNVIDYITITTTGNATDFGDLTQSRCAMSSFGSSTRSIWAGGTDASDNSGSRVNTIDYVTPSSAGNATDFGDLNYTGGNGAGFNSPTRGVSGGGPSTQATVISYITIATTGNATSFGTLSQNAKFLGGCSSTTRGLFVGGATSGGTAINVIQYVTIATTGNSTDFGDLTETSEGAIAASNSTTAIVFKNLTISSITIATTGNAVSFGTLAAATYYSQAGCASPLKAVTTRGIAASNTIEYVTISSAGNAVDFGDLTTVRQQVGAVSSANGGT